MADDIGSPRYDLLEAARGIWQGRADDAVAVLEGLAGRMPAVVEPVRLRYLGSAHLLAGRTTEATACALEARRAAHLARDGEEEVRATALLGRIGSHASSDAELGAAVALLDRCVRDCDDGKVDDLFFLFGCLVDLGLALANRGQSRPALATLRRAIALSARFNEPRLLAELYNDLAEACLARRDTGAAVMYKQKCVQIHEEHALQDRVSAASALATRLAGDAQQTTSR